MSTQDTNVLFLCYNIFKCQNIYPRTGQSCITIFYIFTFPNLWYTQIVSYDLSLPRWFSLSVWQQHVFSKKMKEPNRNPQYDNLFLSFLSVVPFYYPSKHGVCIQHCVHVCVREGPSVCLWGYIVLAPLHEVSLNMFNVSNVWKCCWIILCWVTNNIFIKTVYLLLCCIFGAFRYWKKKRKTE